MPKPPSKYKAVVDDVTRKIASGELAEEAEFPTVRELAEMYAMSTSTVERAIPVLEDRGLIRGQRGSARWVAAGAQQRAQDRLAQDVPE